MQQNNTFFWQKPQKTQTAHKADFSFINTYENYLLQKKDWSIYE